MPPDLERRFSQLLLGLPQWEEKDSRKALATVLRDHEIWDHLDLSGNAASAAGRLLLLYDTYGPPPYLLLLSSLREAHRSHPEHLREIGALETALRGCQPKRPRERWGGVPYRGLSYFDRRHAPIFFGRETEVDALIRTLTTTAQGGCFTVVVGASGSGKSSLVRAGLWARLAAGRIPELPGSERWLVTAMTPLEMGPPADTLRAALVHAIQEQDGFEDQRDVAAGAGCASPAELAERLLPPGDARWLLILDQMEELFGAGQQREGAAFLDSLIEGTRTRPSGRPSRFQVVATLRADFFHHCLSHPVLKRAVARDGGTFLLGPPGRLALERMIGGPITEVDLPQPWILDPELPPAMAADAERNSGGLALMAFALRELYDRCKPDRRLDLQTYRSPEFGGLSGAIARRADATLASLGEGRSAALQRVFARLVRINQDDAPVRRRESRSAWDGDTEALNLVDAFVKARLLVAGPDIEVAHEALLREWPTLAGWIEQRREAFRLAERVRTEAHAWMEGNPAWHHRRPWPPEMIEDVRARLAETCLLHPLMDDPYVARLLTPEADWILAEVKRPDTSHTRRRDIGQRLAKIGDPRRGVGTIDGLPDILWRPIPGGEVEIEGHGRFPVQPFQMAAFPVTFGQFRAFLEAQDGYEDQRWWEGLKRESTDDAWRSPLVNHLVTGVSWYDATAFCRWLAARLGDEVLLPDEPEWQWAAQSAQDTFAYPWGPDWREGLANTSESDIRRTTAVGMYPPGDSLQGVSDLAGNVWEWCRNQYKKSRRSGTKGEESRVLRGGSWYGRRDGARAQCRLFVPPDYRADFIGFRVVCSSPIR